jgi:CHAD domain-containing protein
VAIGEREFTLAKAGGDADVLARLAVELQLDADPPRTERRVLLDSFDGRLRAAGVQVHWTDGRLVLLEAGAPVRSAEAPFAQRYLTGDLPPGPLRERLAGVLDERALIPMARLEMVVRPIAMLNGDAKTVARLAFERAALLRSETKRVPLGARLRLTGVRGYDGDFARAEAAVRSALQAEESARPLFDVAVEAAGGRPGGVSSKPKVELQEGMAASAAAGLVLGRLAEIAEANLAGTLDDLDTEFLHDLRVSIRRARSLLRELKGAFAPGPLAHLRAELRWAQGITGPVRDLDVQLLEWDHLTGLVPEERAADLAPLHKLLADRRARELATLRRGLRGARFAAAMDAWRALAAAAEQPGDGGPLAGAPVELVGGGRIRHVYRRMVRDGRAIGEDSPAEALHDLRKRGKELRYLLEFFGGLYPAKVVKPMVSALKDLQDMLGRYQDRSVQVEALRGMGDDLAGAAGGPDALIALGSLIDALEADQRAARAEFEDRFAAFASKSERSQVRHTFPKRPTP